MISSTTFSLEKRLFLTARPGLAALIIVAALCCIAGLAGRAQIDRVETAQAEFLEDKGAALAAWRDELVALDAGESAPSPYVARPMNIRMPAVLPPAPLGDFSAASSSLYPTTTLITAWASPADLFASYEFANPQLLALGGFDLSFMIVVIMPLLMIAVSFDILPGERQNGRLRLLSVQAGDIRSATWTRLIIRNAALWVTFAGVTFLLACAPAGSGALGPRLVVFAAWLLIALFYALFWFSVIAVANVAIKKSETLAATLFAAWAVFVFAIPTLGGALAEAAYPPPSRLAYLSEMRQSEVSAIRETAALTMGFLADHPKMTVSDEKVPAYYRSNFLANQEITERTTPILEAFKRSRAERGKLLEILQYASPAMIADKALKAISGGDAARYLAYQDQATTALTDLTAEIGPSVVAKQRVSLAQFDAIPAFEFVDTPLSSQLAQRVLPLGFLVFISALLIGFARRRLAAPLEQIL